MKAFQHQTHQKHEQGIATSLLYCSYEERELAQMAGRVHALFHCTQNLLQAHAQDTAISLAQCHIQKCQMRLSKAIYRDKCAAGLVSHTSRK